MMCAVEFATPSEHPNRPDVLVHRDIKPENILFDLNIQNRVCLGDFGTLFFRDQRL